MNENFSRSMTRPALAILLMVVVTTAGCSATRARHDAPEPSGFLGDYTQLQKHADFPAAAVYVRPGVEWSSYQSIEIASVGMWVNEETENLSPGDRQKLTDLLYQTLHDELAQYFVVTQKPDAHTIRLRAALTQAQGAKVALRTVTTIVPQLRLVGTAVGLVGDTSSTVGSATVEVEGLDAVTNQRLLAAVDSRAGTKAIFTSRAYESWGDVAAAFQLWSKRIAWQLARHGVQRKPGAAMPAEPTESRSL